MKPIDKAKELCEKFNVKTCIIYTEDSVPNIKCESKTTKSVIDDAIICVNQIISLNILYHGRHIANNTAQINYWEEVRNQLEVLKS